VLVDAFVYGSAFRCQRCLMVLLLFGLWKL
jgi:hypothetical protein